MNRQRKIFINTISAHSGEVNYKIKFDKLSLVLSRGELRTFLTKYVFGDLNGLPTKRTTFQKYYCL